RIVSWSCSTVIAVASSGGADEGLGGGGPSIGAVAEANATTPSSMVVFTASSVGAGVATVEEVSLDCEHPAPNTATHSPAPTRNDEHFTTTPHPWRSQFHYS